MRQQTKEVEFSAIIDCSYCIAHFNSIYNNTGNSTIYIKEPAVTIVPQLTLKITGGVLTTLLYNMDKPRGWVYMTLIATPNVVQIGETSIITANFNNIYNGVDISHLKGGYIPDGIPIVFTSTGGHINPVNLLKNGVVNTFFNSTVPTNSTITAKVNDQSLNSYISVFDNSTLTVISTDPVNGSMHVAANKKN